MSIHWKFAYTFDDGHLEVDAPIKVATEPTGMYAAARKDAQVEPPARKLILAPETKTTLVEEKKEEVVTEKVCQLRDSSKEKPSFRLLQNRSKYRFLLQYPSRRRSLNVRSQLSEK